MRDLAVHESGEVIDLAAPTPEHKALLREMLAEREQMGHIRKGVLRCASHGAPMYLQWRHGVLCACHWHGSGPGVHHVALMSVEHRMQVEYVARAADRAGLDTAFEVPLPSRVRPDLVVGPSTAFEVQRSHLAVRQAKTRTTKAINGGMSLSLWLSDKQPRYAPKWMYRVPSATALARDWNRMPPLGSATVTSGLRSLFAEPCRPPYRTRCPERASKWCGKWHLAHRPMTGISLDDLAVGVAIGRFVPARIRSDILLASEADVRKYDVAWVPPAKAPRTTTGGASRERYECHAPRQPAASTPLSSLGMHAHQPDRDGVMRADRACCGEKPPVRAGEPLVLACQLCPKSPSYWRTNR